MDLVPQNASDFYIDLLSKSLEFMRFEQSSFANFMAMKKAGNALHFLQDIAVPLHVREEANKPLKIFAHIKWNQVFDDLLEHNYIQYPVPISQNRSFGCSIN